MILHINKHPFLNFFPYYNTIIHKTRNKFVRDLCPVCYKKDIQSDISEIFIDKTDIFSYNNRHNEQH